MKKAVVSALVISMMISLIAFSASSKGYVADLSHNAYWSTIYNKTEDNKVLFISTGNATTIKIQKYGDDGVALDFVDPVVDPVYHTKGRMILTSKCEWSETVQNTYAWKMNDEISAGVKAEEINFTVKETNSKEYGWSLTKSVAKQYELNREVVPDSAPTGYYGIVMGDPVQLFNYSKIETKKKTGAILSWRSVDMYLPKQYGTTSVYVVFSSDNQSTWQLY